MAIGIQKSSTDGINDVLKGINQMGRWVYELKHENVELRKEIATLSERVAAINGATADQVLANQGDDVVEKINLRLTNDLVTRLDARFNGILQLHTDALKEWLKSQSNARTPE